VAKLVRIRHDNAELTRGVLPHDVPSARRAGPEEKPARALPLPALRMLAEAERDLAWRLTAGHPRAMEYLDSLLPAGLRLDDGAGRITAAVHARTGQAATRTEPTELPAASAESIAPADGGTGAPGSALTTPLRTAEIAGAQARNILAFARAQRPPFLPARAGLSGPALLTVQFAAPSPLGLLQTQP
jgi:hypothetical protein